MATGRFASLVVAGLCPSLAAAGGIDRAAQDISILFREGNRAEVTASRTLADVDGNDIEQGPPGFPFPLDTGAQYEGVVDNFNTAGFGLKFDLGERFSVAFFGQEDFGSDLFYSEDREPSLLGGTTANADAFTLTLVGRYKLTDNFSVHAGVRRSRADGVIRLNGLAYGPVAGYEVDFDQDIGYGFLVGGAFEIPDIALRLAVTYNSRVEHDFRGQESLNGQPLGPKNTTTVETPQTANVDFQTGIAEDTLLLANIRWADWSEFEITPPNFEAQTGTGLVSLEDTISYRLGVARRFTPAFSALAAVLYEPEGEDDLVSPLAPTNGYTGIELGASYTIGPAEIAGGVRHRWLGDAKAETGTPDVARADFSDNTATTFGLRLAYSF